MGNRIHMRQATAADLVEFYGKPHSFSCRAVVAVKDGRVIGVGGVYYYRRQVIAFSEVKPELLESKRDMVVASHATFDLIHRMDVPVYALADDSLMHSAKTLEHYGFEHIGPEENVYMWEPEYLRVEAQ